MSHQNVVHQTIGLTYIVPLISHRYPSVVPSISHLYGLVNVIVVTLVYANYHLSCKCLGSTDVHPNATFVLCLLVFDCVVELVFYCFLYGLHEVKIASILRTRQSELFMRDCTVARFVFYRLYLFLLFLLPAFTYDQSHGMCSYNCWQSDLFKFLFCFFFLRCKVEHVIVCWSVQGSQQFSINNLG